MRANKVMNYESILQVLGEPGCPFCRFMKDFPGRLSFRTPGRTVIHHLCNFHTWGLAAHAARSACSGTLPDSSQRRNLEASPELSVRYLHLAAGGRRSSNSRIHQLPATTSSLPNGYGLRRFSAWSTERSSNRVRLRSLPRRSNPSWKDIGSNSWRISKSSATIPLRYEQLGIAGHAAEFLVSQRGLHAIKERHMLTAGKAVKVSIYLSEGSTHHGHVDIFKHPRFSVLSRSLRRDGAEGRRRIRRRSSSAYVFRWSTSRIISL